MTDKPTGWKTSGLFGDDTDPNARGPLADDPTEAQTRVSDDTPAAGYDPGEHGHTRENLITAVHQETAPAYGNRPAAGYAPDEDDDDNDGYGYGENGDDGDDEGYLDAALAKLGSPVGIAVAAVVLILVLLWIFFGRGGEEEAATAPIQQTAPPAAQQPPGTAAPASGPEPPVRDTGIVIEQPTEPPEGNECKGSYYLKAGSIAWCGQMEDLKDVPEGELLKLEGATYAEFRRVPLDEVEIEDGSQMTGTFGRAEPGKPVLIGWFDRTIVGGTETTEGTYKLIDGDEILLTGNYSDAREGGKVVRTYSERPPGTSLSESSIQKVSFDAPVGTPVPALIGREPSPQEGTQGGEGE